MNNFDSCMYFCSNGFSDVCWSDLNGFKTWFYHACFKLLATSVAFMKAESRTQIL